MDPAKDYSDVAVYFRVNDSEAGELKYVVFWGVGCVKGGKLACAKRDFSGNLSFCRTCNSWDSRRK